MRYVVSLLSVLSIAACNSDDERYAASAADSDGDKMDQEEVALGENQSCPVISSKNWHGWIDESGPAGARRLNISGVVELPTPGYEATWVVGPMDRANPPGLRLKVNFRPPENMVTQVITEQPVSLEMEAIYPHYRVVMISCGDSLLAEIPDVMHTE